MKYWEEQLSEQERFQLFCEDRFREPKVFFTGAENQPLVLEVPLSGQDLQAFEREVSDKRGVWLYFDKLPPSEEEAAAKGGKPPAGKPGAKPGAPAGEELKPVNGKIWIDLTQFTDPNQPASINQERFLVSTIQKQ